jgi:tRNA(Ile)-lysidine synthase
LRDPVLRLWLRDVGLDEPSHLHVAELERQLHAAEDRAPCLRFEHTELRRYRDLLYAMRPARPIPEQWETVWDGAPLDLPGGGWLALEPVTPERVWLRVRYRRGGEHIKPDGSAHTRELRTLLQESGIPPWIRERMPLVYAGDDLLAVGDLFCSETGQAWCATHSTRFGWHP